MDIYKGPVNYIMHHEVYKTGQQLTSVKVVSNSSFKNSKTDINDLTLLEPNNLTDFFNNLIKLKSYKEALVFDITKAENSIKLVQLRDTLGGSGIETALMKTGESLV